MSSIVAKSEPGLVQKIKNQINHELSDPETMKSLLETTFKGLSPQLMKRALLEWMLQGGAFEDFLKGDVYAIAYGDTYSLITSIDYSRKIGARSGVVGVEAPKYVYEEGKLIRCSVTVKKRFPDGYVGEFTAEPAFKEYSTGRNLWASKPETMISKVAEMHALRKACPEELSQKYVEEEMQRETIKAEARDVTPKDWSKEGELLRSCKTVEALEMLYADLPVEGKIALKVVFEEMKAMLITEAKDIV